VETPFLEEETQSLQWKRLFIVVADGTHWWIKSTGTAQHAAALRALFWNKKSKV
jgi:hypothetical protein